MTHRGGLLHGAGRWPRLMAECGRPDHRALPSPGPDDRTIERDEDRKRRVYFLWIGVRFRDSRLGRRRQFDADRQGCSTTQSIFADQLGGGRSTSLEPGEAFTNLAFSPTGFGPIGSRASPSTSPTVTSRRRGGSFINRRHARPNPVHPQHVTAASHADLAVVAGGTPGTG